MIELIHPMYNGYRLDKDLEKARAANVLRLKSTFESLFEKYDKPFEDEADEIDLSTLEITCDKGYLAQFETIPFAEFEGESEAEEGDLLQLELELEAAKIERQNQEKKLKEFCQNEKGFDVFELQLMQVSRTFKKKMKQAANLMKIPKGLAAVRETETKSVSFLENNVEEIKCWKKTEFETALLRLIYPEALVPPSAKSEFKHEYTQNFFQSPKKCLCLQCFDCVLQRQMNPTQFEAFT